MQVVAFASRKRERRMAFPPGRERRDRRRRAQEAAGDDRPGAAAREEAFRHLADLIPKTAGEPQISPARGGSQFKRGPVAPEGAGGRPGE